MRWAWLLVASISVACGGKTIGEDPDPIDPDSGTGSGGDDRRISTLSDAELGQLCDWSAGQLGGYGASQPCGGAIGATTNQQQCVQSTKTFSQRPACTVTIRQYKACIGAIHGNLCEVISQPSCLPLLDCG